MAAAGGGSFSSHQPAKPMTAAVNNVPGPNNRRASPLWRRTSAMLRETASVKSTRARLRMDTTCRTGESEGKLTIPRPNGPSTAPIVRKTAT